MTDPTELHLLRSIVAHPHEDTPRLAYADWLDEHDNHPRAEFIRVQCELARGEERPELVKREAALWKAHAKAWKAGLPKALQNAPFRRGFVERVEVPALSWVCERVEVECERCKGGAYPPLGSAPGDCPDCYGTGTDSARTEWRVTPWAIAVASTHPVTEFVIGGLEPSEGDDGGPDYRWSESMGTDYQSPNTLPSPLFQAIKRATTDIRKLATLKSFRTRELALSALATAAADVVRAKVLEAWAKEVRT